MPALRGGLRWLYPGLRVKRWALLTLVSTALTLFVLLDLVGQIEGVGIPGALGLAGVWRALLLALLLVVSVAGQSIGLAQLVRSVARGVSPHRTQKPSELIYRTRVLERGPRVVALGGGTGLSTLLRGLKEVTGNIVAVVTVTDDGGSSGRLRKELGVLPPGDVRNCLIALAADEARIERLFQHRLRGPEALAGHSLGNLLLAGISQAVGGFDHAVEELSHVLNVRGRVLPATLGKTDLLARMEDGQWVHGETSIASDPRRIAEVRLTAPDVAPHGHVLEAINAADLVLLGPGSLYTSLIPNLLVPGISDAIEESAAEKLLIANLMTQPGETEGYALSDHIRALDEVISIRRFDGVLVNSERPDECLLSTYWEEGAEPVRDDLGPDHDAELEIVRADLLRVVPIEGRLTIKHDPRRLARAIARSSRAFTRSPDRSSL
ncbi:MAG: uridine diphosphate-N-acetylglucosamine-binding protein YvcK [Candidatus Bipolaricaulota bacterium]|nr:MAG: uridine diphosphate-N-acetylglucosamine-binding protein YvcK [Candidatus Bipolaricaulota bacterium]